LVRNHCQKANETHCGTYLGVCLFLASIALTIFPSCLGVYSWISSCIVMFQVGWQEATCKPGCLTMRGWHHHMFFSGCLIIPAGYVGCSFFAMIFVILGAGWRRTATFFAFCFSLSLRHSSLPCAIFPIKPWCFWIWLMRFSWWPLLLWSGPIYTHSSVCCALVWRLSFCTYLAVEDIYYFTYYNAL
jgi:hypothetical protein